MLDGGRDDLDSRQYGWPGESGRDAESRQHLASDKNTSRKRGESECKRLLIGPNGDYYHTLCAQGMTTDRTWLWRGVAARTDVGLGWTAADWAEWGVGPVVAWAVSCRQLSVPLVRSGYQLIASLAVRRTKPTPLGPRRRSDCFGGLACLPACLALFSPRRLRHRSLPRQLRVVSCSSGRRS